MGTGPFAVPSFERIRAEGRHSIELVVTTADQERRYESL